MKLGVVASPNPNMKDYNMKTSVKSIRKTFIIAKLNCLRTSIFHPSIKDFEGISEINSNISFSGNRPIDYFNYFRDSSLLQKIVGETNRYVTQNPITQSSHKKAWPPVTKTELENFLDLSILMGHVQKGDLQNYWSTDLLLHTPIFGQIMSRDRYIQILRYLHFHDNKEIVNHPLVKIKSVMGHVQSTFFAVLAPGKNLCLILV